MSLYQESKKYFNINFKKSNEFICKKNYTENSQATNKINSNFMKKILNKL